MSCRLHTSSATSAEIQTDVRETRRNHLLHLCGGEHQALRTRSVHGQVFALPGRVAHERMAHWGQGTELGGARLRVKHVASGCEWLRMAANGWLIVEKSGRRTNTLQLLPERGLVQPASLPASGSDSFLPTRTKLLGCSERESADPPPWDLRQDVDHRPGLQWLERKRDCSRGLPWTHRRRTCGPIFSLFSQDMTKPSSWLRAAETVEIAGRVPDTRKDARENYHSSTIT